MSTAHCCVVTIKALVRAAMRTKSKSAKPKSWLSSARGDHWRIEYVQEHDLQCWTRGFRPVRIPEILWVLALRDVPAAQPIPDHTCRVAGPAHPEEDDVVGGYLVGVSVDRRVLQIFSQPPFLPQFPSSITVVLHKPCGSPGQLLPLFISTHRIVLSIARSSVRRSASRKPRFGRAAGSKPHTRDVASPSGTPRSMA